MPIDRPLHVVHSHPVWLPQTQPWLYNLVRYLPEADIESCVVCDRTENLQQFPVRRLHALRERRYWPFWEQRLLDRFQARPSGRFLRTLGRRFQADLVHSHFGNIGWCDIPAVRGMPAKHVVTFYGFEIGRLPRHEPVWLDRYAEMFASADLITTQGPDMTRAVVELGCPESKVRICRLGVETDRIPYQPRQWHPGTPLRVLIAASFVEKKGIPYALHALAKIKSDVPLEVTVIGDSRADLESRSEKQRILDAISLGGLENHVRLLGFQPHQTMLKEAYRNHVFLSPSVTAADGDTEGGTVLAIIEMVATGLPVISSRHCDIPTIIEHGRTGFLAEEKDVDGLADCLRWLIGHPDQWEALTDAGRRHIDQNFDAATQGVELASLYSHVALPHAAYGRENRTERQNERAGDPLR